MTHPDLLKLARNAGLALLGFAALLPQAASGAQTLAQTYEAALAASRPVRAAGMVTDSARAGLDAAKAQRMPAVTVSANHFRLENELAVAALGTRIPVMDRSTTGVSAMASVPLFTGGTITHGIEAAESVLASAELMRRSTANDIRYQAALVYVGVLEARAYLDAALAHRAALAAHRKQVQARLKKGMAVKNELYAVQAAYMSAEDAVIAAGSARESACAAYNRLLDRALDAPVDLEPLPPAQISGTLEELTDRALASSTRLAAMSRDEQAARSAAAAERGQKWPQVGLMGGWMRQSDRYLSEDSGWIAGVVMKWEVFDAGLRSSRAQVGERQADALAERRSEAASVLRLAVKNAWLAWQESQARQAAAQASLASAVENLRVSSRRYAEGLTIHTEVLDAESLRQAAQARLIKAQNDARRAHFTLARLTESL